MKNKILNFALVVILIFVSWLLYVIAKTDYSSKVPKEQTCNESYFNLGNHIHNMDKLKFYELFPYQIYLDSANRCDINSIRRDLQLLDSVNPGNQSVNEKILLNSLTDKLEKRISTSFTTFNPDSLILIVRWADKFGYYKDLDIGRARFYRIVHRYWLNYVSNKLGEYYDKRHSIKYDYKFKYLVTFCQAKNFPPPIGNSSFEKLISNLTEGQWAYLFSRFWNATTIPVKIFSFLILLSIVYGYFCIYKVHFKAPIL